MEMKILLVSPFKDVSATVGNFIFFQDKFTYEEEEPTKFKEQVENLICSNQRVTVSLSPEINKLKLKSLADLVNNKIINEKIPFVFLIKHSENYSVINHYEDLLFQKILIHNLKNTVTKFCVLSYKGVRDEIDEKSDPALDELIEKKHKAYVNFLSITTGFSKLSTFSFNFYQASKFYESFFDFLFKEPANINVTDKEIIELFLEKGNYLGELIVTGRAGQGKSTLLNHLFNKSLAKEAGIECAAGVTKEIVAYKDFFYTDRKTEHKIRIYDMPGYGDLTVSKDMLIKFWRDNLCRREIKFILYVKRVDDARIMKDEAVMLDVFCSCVVESGVPSENIIFVATHCDKMESEVKTDLAISNMLKCLNERNKLNISKFIKFSKKNPVPALKELYDHCIKTKSVLKLSKNINFERAWIIIMEGCYSGAITCFSCDTSVRIFQAGREMEYRIDSVKVGDMILTGGESKYEKVLTVTHCNDERSYRVLKISFSNGKYLKISHLHYMMIKKNERKYKKVLAKEIKIGDEVSFIDFHHTFTVAKVTQIEEVYVSAMTNVRTPSCKIVVNGLICSVKTQHDLGILGNYALNLAGKINPNLPQKINSFFVNLQKNLIGK